LPCTLVYLLDDCFVTIYKALNHLHVLAIGTMEDIDDVAYEEGDHTKQNITQGIIQYS